MSTLRAMFRYWPGEPFLESEEQKEIARLLREAGYTEDEHDTFLSSMLRDPDLAFHWQQRVCEVLRLESIGLDVKVLKLRAQKAFGLVRHQLLNECPSPFESNRNASGLISLKRVRKS